MVTTLNDGSIIRKFLFDQSFDGMSNSSPMGSQNNQAASRIQGNLPTFTFEQIEEAKAASYAEGLAAGNQAADQDALVRTATLLMQIERQLSRIIERAEADRKEQARITIDFAMTVARKILPSFLEKNGAQEIEELISNCLAERQSEPRLVIRLPDLLLDTVGGRIKEITEKQAFGGKVVLLADPNLGIGDCRIEWADGGIERETEYVWHEIERVVCRAVSEGQNDVKTNPLAVEQSQASPTTFVAV